MSGNRGPVKRPVKRKKADAASLLRIAMIVLLSIAVIAVTVILIWNAILDHYLEKVNVVTGKETGLVYETETIVEDNTVTTLPQQTETLGTVEDPFDENGKLNLSALKVGADILVVSNFTLYANLSSRRPDFLQSMKYEGAKKLYEYFLEKMQKEADALRETGDPAVKIFPGVFGGDMKVEIVNDGPITIVVDTDQL